MVTKRWTATVLAFVCSFNFGCAEMGTQYPIGDIVQATMGALGGPGGGDSSRVAAGLREALKVGTERATGRTSTVDGFLGNTLIRIGTPSELRTMATALRTVGFGAQVDQLEVAMNRAAEQASGEARSVFWNAVSSMTLTDAVGILNGGDTAATQYFQRRTSDTLRTRFRPIVEQKMGEVGLYQTYKSLSDAYNAMPFVTAPAVDLEQYVTDQALSGLFTVLGEEETRIRRDPVARSSELLREVFGNR